MKFIVLGLFIFSLIIFSSYPLASIIIFIFLISILIKKYYLFLIIYIPYNKKIKKANSPKTLIQELKILSTDQNSKVRQEVISNPNTPAETLKQLANDQNKEVCQSAINRLINLVDRQEISVQHLQELANQDNTILKQTIKRGYIPEDILHELANNNNNINIRKIIASNLETPKKTIQLLAKDKNNEVRLETALNVNTPGETFVELAGDENKEISDSALKTVTRLVEKKEISIQYLTDSKKENEIKYKNTPKYIEKSDIQSLNNSGWKYGTENDQARIEFKFGFNYFKKMARDLNHHNPVYNSTIGDSINTNISLAKGHLDKAIKLDKNYYIAYYMRANCHSSLGEITNAIEDCDQAIKINPNFIDAYLSRGWFRKTKGYFYAAIEDFNSAINLDEQHPLAYNNRAGVYFELKEYEKAIQDLHEAEKISKNFSYIYDLKEGVEIYTDVCNNLGANYYAIGNYSKAKHYFTLARDSFYEQKHYEEYNRMLRILAYL